MKIRSLVIFLILLNFLYCLCFSSINYKISGRVIYDGVGIENMKIVINNESQWDWRLGSEIKTDKNGNFEFYVQKGIYSIKIYSQKGYVTKENKKILTVKNKNITNVILFLEKACTVYGVIKFEDNTPLKGSVDVSNDRGVWRSRINKLNGEYSVTGIRSSENTDVFFWTDDVLPQYKIISLNEGENFKLDRTIPKIVSIKGKIVDKQTQEIITSCGIAVSYSTNQFTGKQNSQGYFYIYNLAPGNYNLFIFKYGYKEMIKKITIVENEIKELVIELEKMSEQEKVKEYGRLIKKKN